MLVKHMTVTDKRGNNKTNKAGKPLLRSAGCVSDTIKNNEKVIGDHYTCPNSRSPTITIPYFYS